VKRYPTHHILVGSMFRMEAARHMMGNMKSKNKLDKYASSSPVLDILAFGDSLTEGFCRGGSQWHPYSLHLQKCLSDQGTVQVGLLKD